MSQDLRKRCGEFVKTAPPPDLGHVDGSIAERVLAGYAAGVTLDDETLELLELVIADSRETAGVIGGAAAEYLLASAALLEEIAGGA